MKRAILLTKNKLPKRIALLLTNVTCLLKQEYSVAAVKENTQRLIDIGYSRESADVIARNVARKIKKRANRAITGR